MYRLSDWQHVTTLNSSYGNLSIKVSHTSNEDHSATNYDHMLIWDCSGFVCAYVCVCVCKRAEGGGTQSSLLSFKTLPAAPHISFSLMEQRISSAWDQSAWARECMRIVCAMRGWSASTWCFDTRTQWLYWDLNIPFWFAASLNQVRSLFHLQKKCF